MSAEKKLVIVPCSGIGKSHGTVSREAAYDVVEDRVCAGDEKLEVIRARVRKALQSAEKYSLVANSVKSAIHVEPEVEIVEERMLFPG